MFITSSTNTTTRMTDMKINDPKTQDRVARVLAIIAIVMLVGMMSGCVTLDGFAYYGSICERPSCR